MAIPFVIDFSESLELPKEPAPEDYPLVRTLESNELDAYLIRDDMETQQISDESYKVKVKLQIPYQTNAGTEDLRFKSIGVLVKLVAESSLPSTVEISNGYSILENNLSLSIMSYNNNTTYECTDIHIVCNSGTTKINSNAFTELFRFELPNNVFVTSICDEDDELGLSIVHKTLPIGIYTPRGAPTLVYYLSLDRGTSATIDDNNFSRGFSTSSKNSGITIGKGVARGCNLEFYSPLKARIASGRIDNVSASDSRRVIDLLLRQVGGSISESYSSTDTNSVSVKYWKDVDKKDKVGETVLSSPITTTRTYTPNKVDSSGNHYGTLDKSDISEVNLFINKGKTLKFYLTAQRRTDYTDGPSLPQQLTPATRVGYRSEEGGKKDNNIYYSCMNGQRVNGGDKVNEDIINDNYVVELYLKWVAKTYTIVFNKGGSNNTWVLSSNTFSVNKTYDDDINVGEDGYPGEETIVSTTGKIHYGGISGKETTDINADKARCVYTYPSYPPPYNAYEQQKIDDVGYDDNLDVVNVYPCWDYIKHYVVSKYFIKDSNGDVVTDPIVENTEFNIDTSYTRISAPKTKSKNGNFLGGAQGTKNDGPEGNGGKWGRSPAQDQRDYGVFKYVSDLDNTPYYPTYGVDKTSLTNAEGNDVSKKLYIYGLYSIDSRMVFVDGKGKPTTGMWVYIDGKWRMIEQIGRRRGDPKNDGWSEITE